MTMCGGEFGGDCFQFVKKHLKIEWKNYFCETTVLACSETKAESHICTPQEITQNHYDSGRLYMCPPADELYLYNNFEYYPQKGIGLEISPNYEKIEDNKVAQNEMSNFQIAREEMKSSYDLSITGPSPIIKNPVWLGRY